MSQDPARKFHATTWIISTVAALLVYVATWPLVEIKSSKLVYTNVGGVTYIEQKQPSWVGVIYWPMFRLCELNDGNNPLWEYYNWCQRNIKEEVSHP